MNHADPRCNQAQRFIAKCISSCNVEELNLKPDNLFLFMHLIYTDLMLSLDYHNSTLEPAPNGIGATVIVCDGGGSYRSELGPNYDKVLLAATCCCRCTELNHDAPR